MRLQPLLHGHVELTWLCTGFWGHCFVLKLILGTTISEFYGIRHQLLITLPKTLLLSSQGRAWLLPQPQQLPAAQT